MPLHQGRESRFGQWFLPLEESLQQLTHETDQCHSAFLCKVLGMYSSQLETKHQGLGERIAETCQEIYVTIREHEIG